MIAAEKKQAVIDAIEQLQDETAFEQIAAFVKAALATAAPRSKAGFLKGSVRYLVDDWDAPLPDTDWQAHA